MAVTVPPDVCRRYRRFSLYNSPYPAHDHGCAIDLYPWTNDGVSPVAGVVRETRRLGCPDRSYAVDYDHLIVVDLAASWLEAAGVDPTENWYARILHVDPDVEPGETVAVGDSLGSLVRSGYFGQWVDNHIHLGFRPAGENPLRATGSQPVDVGVSIQPIPWDGTGTVVETGPTHAMLDAPRHPDPASGSFVAIADDAGRPLDGGVCHYTGGGLFGSGRDAVGKKRGGIESTRMQVEFLGERLGTMSAGDASSQVNGRRDLTWADVDVLANGTRITGISLFAAQDEAFGAKLVVRDSEFEVGEEVRVTIEPSADPIRLGVGR